GLLDQFTNNDMPRVAISVDMLDTGIDIREIVNLVFAKPVYSYTKFWQMIGRGTRLLEENKIKPWCPEKDMFLIIDCWDNFEYFKLNPKGKENKQQIPLPVKFVGIRINKIEKAIDINKNKIAEKEIIYLREQINELPKDSVVIKDAAKSLSNLKDNEFWEKMSHEKIEFLRNTIKPLFRTISQTDFKAMRFKKDVLEISLSALSEENDKYTTLKDGLIEQISELPLSVNIVAREETLINKAQTNHYWATATNDTFDELSLKLAPLAKFRNIDGPETGPAIFDFKDSVFLKEMVEFGPEHESISISKYREMVETMILELTLNNPVLQKIKQGEVISESQINQLADALHQEHPHITIDLLRKTYNNPKAKFIQFIRHILGLEILETFPNTVTRAFDAFI
ncbi:MAG: restriction endonuclease subunit R, partial [Desulfobacula sp.]|nr:restriction endonuclease subunit R [Desulfobacula sp.]